MMIGKLVVNGQVLDLSENIPVPITYSIADIKNPDKRKRNSSKNITLPGTQNNMRFFSSAYRLSLTEIESGGIIGFEFDPTIRIEAQYYKNGKKIFDGLVQLLTVSVKDKVYSFNVVLFSNYIDLFQALGDMKVAELGWSEYDHELNFTNIQNSWDTSVVLNGTPTSNFTGGVPDGFGYLYPLADYGYSTNLRDYLTNNIFPHVYVKEVMNKAFGIAGLTIDSTFMDTELFKRLIFGFGGGQKITIPPAEVTARRVNYNGAGTYATEIHHSFSQYISQDFVYGAHYQYTFNFNQRLKWGDNFWMAVTLVNDDLTQMDEPGEEITISRSGNYNMTFTGDIDVTQNIVGTVLPGSSLQMFLRVAVYKNGYQVGTYKLTNTGTSTTVSINTTLSFNFVAGDIIHTEIQPYINGLGLLRSVDPPSAAPYIEYELTDNGGWNQDMQSVQAAVVDGDTMYISNYLPDMKASDFVRGIITMFNLYTSDPDVNSACVVEPLDEFYFDTDTFDDYTDKIDYSKEYNVKPASNIEGKVYAYRWKADQDYYNELYRGKNGIGYGDYLYQVPSTFLKGERVFEIPFAQTIPVEVPGSNIIIPTIIKYDESSGIVSPFKGSPRIYIYSGLRNSDSWVLRNSQDNTTTATFTSYPCINHLDDIDSPTFDLNFGVPIEVYWSATDYTIVNIFSEYHERFVRETTGKDAKIVTFYVKLNESDVQPEKMRTLAMVNGVLFRKNEIRDFNGNGEDTIPVELVRIVTGKKRRNVGSYARPGILVLSEVIIGGKVVGGSEPADISEEVSTGGLNSTMQSSEAIFFK